MAEALPVEILLGIYLGLLVGVVPALVSWGLGFAFKYVTDVSLPGAGVVVIAISLAGVNGWLLAVSEKAVAQSPTPPRVATAVVIVAMVSLYAHSKGDEMGATFPQEVSLSSLGARTLSTELADLVSGGSEVRVHVVGEVADMEGHPPLPEELRAKLRNAELTFPADLRIEELEERMADRLRTEYDLGDVSVAIDERGRATLVAAPPFSGLSKRVDDDRHAVSVSGLIPTGLARGDEVTVITPDAQVRGTVVSAQTGEDTEREAGPHSPGETEDEDRPTPVRAPTTEGGEGRLTVAVTRTDVQPLLRAAETKVVVESRGTRREYEVVSMLRRADKQFRRFTVHAGSPLDGRRLGTARVREAYGVAVLAVRSAGGWLVAPDGVTHVEEGDQVFAAGRRDELDDFAEAIEPAGRPGGAD